MAFIFPACRLHRSGFVGFTQVVNIYDIDARTYEFKLALPVDVGTASSAIVSASTSLGVDATAGAGAVASEAGGASDGIDEAMPVRVMGGDGRGERVLQLV